MHRKSENIRITRLSLKAKPCYICIIECAYSRIRRSDHHTRMIKTIVPGATANRKFPNTPVARTRTRTQTHPNGFYVIKPGRVDLVMAYKSFSSAGHVYGCRARKSRPGTIPIICYGRRAAIFKIV